eukprot:3823360-Pleurochrysis_carterae.AAC.1
MVGRRAGGEGEAARRKRRCGRVGQARAGARAEETRARAERRAHQSEVETPLDLRNSTRKACLWPAKRHPFTASDHTSPFAGPSTCRTSNIIYVLQPELHAQVASFTNVPHTCPVSSHLASRAF